MLRINHFVNGFLSNFSSIYMICYFDFLFEHAARLNLFAFDF